MSQFNEFDAELAAEAAYGMSEADYNDYMLANGRGYGQDGDLTYDEWQDEQRAALDDMDDMDEDERYMGEDMDGDFDSGMASAGFGTDEDYGYYDYDGMDYDFNMHTEGY